MFLLMYKISCLALFTLFLGYTIWKYRKNANINAKGIDNFYIFLLMFSLVSKKRLNSFFSV